MISRENVSSNCGESDSNIINNVFKVYKLSENLRNIYSYIIKGLASSRPSISQLETIFTDISAITLYYRPHGIKIFSDLASLLEVFGNSLENKITLTNNVSLIVYFYTETGNVRHG